ncbi:family 47 glycosyl hydrolase [Lasiosphaeria hispida]|uniref:alpha-1,2-Mannosidase n=1 Tax=Lasiosphaeria hispida TaxID=260671 RepID=A0AAJ0HAM1_9PEZI|nr:family 47 glycosyl hydrolase [Lasiosphaeria hispida]
MAAARLQRRSRRTVFIAVLVLFVFAYYLSSSPPLHGIFAQPGPESVWLERHMNKNADTSSLKSNSSFDWSKVQFKYPPGPLRKIPTGRPVSLPQVQHNFPPEIPAAAQTREARRQRVRDLFRKNWASYRKYAWKKDALQPITADYKDQFSGWAATLVDALDTLWIMGLRGEFDEAVAAVADIDFGSSSTPAVNMFEVNIRYLGGLLAAYDLSQRDVLLTKAIELGDLLYAGYNTKNRMPVDFIDFARAKSGKGLTVESGVVAASPGTLSMEMTRLSQVTGDSKYYDAVSRVMDVFAKGQEWTKIPGLWPMYVSMETQDVVLGSSFTIAGSVDSLYEYIPKMHALLGGLDQKYDVMSKRFMEAANSTFFFRPMLPGEEDLLMIGNAMVDETGAVNFDPESEHLGCFVGGVYGLAGRLFRRPEWVDDIGSKLTHGCIYAYRSMPTGMMPERYNMVPCESRENCKWNETAFDEGKRLRREWAPHLPKGFTTAKDPRYILRPEAIESVFVMYRITGRQEFQEAAWDMFTAIANGTATEYANAAVLDVTKAEYPLPQEDYMESFWLAETLKYFYLAFSPPDVISLDDYVLNTEAHPFRRPKGATATRPL